jgi:hypothetical protein
MRALWIIFLFRCIPVVAQIDDWIKPATSLALGGQLMHLPIAESALANASNLAFLQNSELSVSAESRFIGTGIQGSMLASAFKPSADQGFYTSIDYYGIPAFYRWAVSLAYGRKLSRTTALGIGTRWIYYNNERREPYDQKRFQLSMQQLVLPSLKISAAIHAQLDKSLLQSGKTTLYILGTEYKVSPWVYFYGETEFYTLESMNLRLGVEYKIKESVSIRTGIATNPYQYAIGLGWQKNKKWGLDIGFSYYQSIGMTPGLSFRWRFGHIQNGAI